MIGRAMKYTRLALTGLALCLFAAPVAAQRPSEPFTTSSGVPDPPFGINERAGPATYYVDNSQAGATDSGNTNGTTNRPRLTIPTRVAAGAIVEVHGGPYDVGRTTWEGAGSAAAPVFFRGVGDPVINGRELSLGTSYLIVEGFIFDGIPVLMPATSSFVVLRQSIVRNWSPTVNSAAILPMGTNLVIYGNEINNNGNPDSSSELDIHGIKPIAGADHVWIVNNNIHHNGGDGVQIGNATSPEPWPRFIYIAHNSIHQDRENAVDIKKARDVIVSGNLLYGYEARSSSSGEVIVTHDNAERIWILNNGVGSSRQGIVCTGANGYVVLGNVINGIQHHPADTSYDPNSLFRASAILTYNTTSSAHLNNTIWDSDAGISYASGNAPTEIVNNIIGPLSQPAHHIALGNSQAVAGSRVRANIIVADPRIRWGGGTVEGCPSADVCTRAEPQLVDPPRNFRLTKGSPAIDAGVDSAAYSAFRQLYGFSLAADIYGVPRPQGPALDVGAAEFSTGTPPSPQNVHIVR